MKTERPFRVTGSHVAFRCPWFAIRRDDLVLPDGSRGEYNVLVKGDGVWVVPVTADSRVVLVRAYRHAVDDWCLEVPAGTRKDGATAEETARTELAEEVGGVATSIERVCGFYIASGVLSEAGHVFLARGVALGEPRREPAEVMETLVVPVDEALRWARDGTMTDAPSALALLRCEERLRTA